MITETVNVALQRRSDNRIMGLATFIVRLRHEGGKLLSSAELTAVDGDPATMAQQLGLSQDDYAMACHVAELRARERLVYLPICD